jgi:deazaflavin-dependent oxidoreductase (nitroreductase family)
MLVFGLIGRPEAWLNTSSPLDRKSRSNKALNLMANWLMFTRAHCAVYRGTRGLIGGNLFGIKMLLLTTRGRKSGLRRTLPLSYVEHKGDLIVVASNGGSDRDPAWWLNLQAAETAEVQVNGKTFPVTWVEAPQKERTEYWRKLQAAIPAYRMYRFQSEREIPIVLLHRQSEATWESVPLRAHAVGSHDVAPAHRDDVRAAGAQTNR